MGEVDFVYLPSNNGARTFQLGRLEAIILSEPLVTITLNSFDQAVLSFDIQEEWGKLHDGEERIPFVGLFVRGGFARENPELIDLINEYYRRGSLGAGESREAAPWQLSISASRRKSSRHPWTGFTWKSTLRLKPGSWLNYSSAKSWSSTPR